MTDNTKLIARTRDIPVEKYNELMGTHFIASAAMARRKIKLSQLGALCDYLHCQPQDLIEFREESDCVWYLSLKVRRFNKMRKLVKERYRTVEDFCRKANISSATFRNDSMSLPVICVIAVTLGVRIRDIVEGE